MYIGIEDSIEGKKNSGFLPGDHTWPACLSARPVSNILWSGDRPRAGRPLGQAFPRRSSSRGPNALRCALRPDGFLRGPQTESLGRGSKVLFTSVSRLARYFQTEILHGNCDHLTFLYFSNKYTIKCRDLYIKNSEMKTQQNGSFQLYVIYWQYYIQKYSLWMSANFHFTISFV